MQREDGPINYVTTVVATKKGRFNLLKLASTIIVVAGIFTLGWLFGSGRVTLGRLSTTNTNKALPSRLDYSSVDTIYKSLKNSYDGKIDEAKLLDGIKTGMANAVGDPYTEYFSVKDAKEFYGQLDGTFEGIGAELGKNEAGNVQIISPLAGYPAEKAGLRPKDIIAAIDGKDTTGFSIDDAVKKIRGKAGTDVKLTIIRDGAAQNITITREAITVPSVKSEIRDGIGILTISRFGDDTSALAKKAATEFKSQGVKGIVLDLRGDPGGLLDAAVSVSSLWLQNKTVLTERRDGKIIETYSSRGTATLNGIPTVVLLNAGSASASEITAGALRDNKAATLLGEKSYGKGSVQQPIDLADGSLLKVTIARWYTPNGKNIDKEGITPDKEIKVTDEDLAAGNDPQLDAALSQLAQ